MAIPWVNLGRRADDTTVKGWFNCPYRAADDSHYLYSGGTNGLNHLQRWDAGDEWWSMALEGNGPQPGLRLPKHWFPDPGARFPAAVDNGFSVWDQVNDELWVNCVNPWGAMVDGVRIHYTPAIYSPADSTWRPATTEEFPTFDLRGLEKLFNPGADSIPGGALIYGGAPGSQQDLWAYDGVGRSWTHYPNHGAGGPGKVTNIQCQFRYMPALQAVMLYHRGLTWRLPLDTFQWVLQATTGLPHEDTGPAAGKGIAALPVRDRWIAAWGGDTTMDIFLLDTQTWAWTRVPTTGLAPPLSYTGSWVVGSRLYSWTRAGIIMADLTPVLDALEGTGPGDTTPKGRWTGLEWPDRGRGVRSGKHVSAAWCPHDGRLYFVGGDYATLRGTGSYVQQTFSLALAERLASPADHNAGWREEFPYCAPEGKIAPKGPDTVGWVWDVLRRQFWMIPGQMVPSNTGCPGQSNVNASDAVYKLGSVMTFTPSFVPGVYGTWEEPTGLTYPGRIIGAARHCVYDAAEDRILRARYDGLQGGLIFEAMPCGAADQWQTLLQDRARGLRNALGKECRIEHEYLAWDPAGRRCYAVDGTAVPVPRLMAWDLPSNLLMDFGEVPGGPYPTGLLNSEWSHVVWSARQQRLYFYRIRDPEGFYAWDPATQQWTTLSLASDRPDAHGGLAFGRSVAYDADADCLMLHGGVGSAAVPYFYLYRPMEGSA